MWTRAGKERTKAYFTPDDKQVVLNTLLLSVWYVSCFADKFFISLSSTNLPATKGISTMTTCWVTKAERPTTMINVVFGGCKATQNHIYGNEIRDDSPPPLPPHGLGGGAQYLSASPLDLAKKCHKWSFFSKEPHKELSRLQNPVLGASKGLPPWFGQKMLQMKFFLVRSHIKNFQSFKIWFGTCFGDLLATTL